jgi:hypothetical protein
LLSVVGSQKRVRGALPVSAHVPEAYCRFTKKGREENTRQWYGAWPLTALRRLFPVAGSAVAIKPWPESLGASVPLFALFALEPILFPLLCLVIMTKILDALGGVSRPSPIACLALVNLDLHLGGVEHLFFNLQGGGQISTGGPKNDGVEDFFFNFLGVSFMQG